MSIMKTFALAALCSISLTHSAIASSNLYMVFGGCVGRFSAELEHAWLVGDPASQDIEATRATFISLLEATMPPDSGRYVLTHRLDHKIAQASLLTIATFSRDTDRARAALLSAKTYRRACERLLLDG